MVHEQYMDLIFTVPRPGGKGFWATTFAKRYMGALP